MKTTDAAAKFIPGYNNNKEPITKGQGMSFGKLLLISVGLLGGIILLGPFLMFLGFVGWVLFKGVELINVSCTLKRAELKRLLNNDDQ